MTTRTFIRLAIFLLLGAALATGDTLLAQTRDKGPVVLSARRHRSGR